jgi:hypothetical protein
LSVRAKGFSRSLRNVGLEPADLSQPWQDALFDVYFNQGGLGSDTSARLKTRDFNGIALSWDIASLTPSSQGAGLSIRWADRLQIVYGDYSSPCKRQDAVACPNFASLGGAS